MPTDVSEFPFVAELPKREQNRVQTAWERFRGYLQVVEEHGAPVRFYQAALLLGISPQRIEQLVQTGRFTVIVGPDGAQSIGAKSLVEFAETERHCGRPTKLSQTVNGRLLIRLNAASK